MRDGPDAAGVPKDSMEHMGGAPELWAAACDGDAMPSAVVAALVALCDLASRAIQLSKGTAMRVYIYISIYIYLYISIYIYIYI